MISDDLVCIIFVFSQIFNRRSSRRHPVEDAEYQIQLNQDYDFLVKRFIDEKIGNYTCLLGWDWQFGSSLVVVIFSIVIFLNVVAKANFLRSRWKPRLALARQEQDRQPQYQDQNWTIQNQTGESSWAMTKTIWQIRLTTLDYNKFGVGVHTPFLVRVGRMGQRRHHILGWWGTESTLLDFLLLLLINYYYDVK